MRRETFPLQFMSSVAAGAWQDCENLVEKYVQVEGTFTATVAIEGRFTDTGAAIVVASVTTPGATAVPQPFKQIRLNTTAFTSSTPTPVGLLAGRQSRTE